MVAPSATSQYSNYGVGLLGEALAIHKATTYPELLTERVLVPFGLRSASFKVVGGEKRKRLTDGYMSGELTPHWSLPSLAGAGGLRVPTRLWPRRQQGHSKKKTAVKQRH